ncbi:probable glutamate receptor [Penaeus vannamei]|uniref:probable glutamate receptor n=1 Tax=Penaeus vannamei TaxID=6689 RepID=UPI00387F9A0F
MERAKELITIANISPEGDTATLWEAYQITAHMDQKLTRVGLWTLRQDESTTPHEHHNQGDPNARTTTGEWALHSHPLRNGVLRGASSTIRGRKGMVRKSMRYGVLEAYLDDPIMGRTDLTGLHLRCTTIMVRYAPLTTVIERGDGSVLLAGFYGKILDTLQEWTNFTYTCHHVQDGQWGSKVDGEWNGMMKELLEGTADIAVSPLSITEVRSTAADFLYGLTTSSFKIIVRRPLNEDYMWTAYSKQFEIGVWGMIVFVVMILALSLFAVSYFSERVQISLADCVFAIIGIFLGKGVEQKTETGAGRTLILTALLAHVILLTFYTSNLVSALTVGPPLPPLKNLQDVYNDRSLRFGFLKGSSLTNMFDLPNPLFQAILREMKEEDFVDTPDEGMERVLGERYAFMEWELFYDLNYGSECGVFALPASYFPSYASLALTKGSPLVPVLNRIIMDILMAGLPTKWWLELKHVTEDCNLPQTSAIELKTMLTPFLVLGIGILVSFGFLCAEVLLRRDSSGGTLRAGEQL